MVNAFLLLPFFHLNHGSLLPLVNPVLIMASTESELFRAVPGESRLGLIGQSMPQLPISM